MKRAACLISLFAAAVLWGAAMDPYASEYGVCAHVGGHENAIAAREFARMNEAGIRYVRADFSWSGVEPKQGTWNFSHLDQVVAQAKKDHIALLPILNYDVAWATPAYRHLPLWTEYVRQVVTRYQHDIPVWEVWNEPNLEGFWREKPDGANYATLLKATYETIKAVNPKLVVLYGGTAGIPMEFIENSFKAGAGRYFDAMNIHPYRWNDLPEKPSLPEDIAKLRELMKRYRIAEKPIWITEMGWPTHRDQSARYQEIFGAMLAAGKIAPDATIGFISDPRYEQVPRFYPPSVLPGAKIVYFTYDEIARCNPKNVPALVVTYGEGFPMKYLDALERYVKRGGMAIFPSGAPLYYDLILKKDGSVESKHAPEAARERFHIGWDAWWINDKRAPKDAKQNEVAAPFRNLIQADGMHTQIFLTDAKLKKGDQLVPIVSLRKGDYSNPIIAVYDLNSDLKGKVAICSYRNREVGSSPDQQARLLPRAILLATGSGIAKYFWYEFQAPETDADDKESHFGIVHSNLEPKPAFTAYQTLILQRPDGSTAPVLRQYPNEVWQAAWHRPDGTAGTALWTPAASVNCRLQLQGKLVEAVDYLGRPVKVDPTAFEVTNGVVYLSGPGLTVTVK